MFHSAHYIKLFGFILFFSLAGCRTDATDLKGACCSKGSAVTGADTAPAYPAVKEDYVWRQVWADGIEQVLPPAGEVPEIARNLTGTWYCRSRDCGKGDGKFGISTGVSVWSLQAAVVNADGSFTFSFWGSNSYAFDGQNLTYRGIQDKAVITESYIQDYRLIFKDADHAELINYAYDDATKRMVPTSGPGKPYRFFMETNPARPGTWVRITTLNGVEQPRYDLVQVVLPDGTRTPAYGSEYLSDLADRVAHGTPGIDADVLRKLLVPVPKDSDLGRGGDIPREGGLWQPPQGQAQTTDGPDKDATDKGSADAAVDREQKDSSRSTQVGVTAKR